MKSVIAETIDIVTEKSPAPLQDVWIDDLVIGIFFTGVKLSTGHAGCAFTPIGEIPEAVCCPTTAARMPQAGNLEGRPVSEIVKYSLDPNVLKSAVGVATLNALSQWVIESKDRVEYHIIKDTDGFDLRNPTGGDCLINRCFRTLHSTTQNDGEPLLYRRKDSSDFKTE